MKHPHIIRLFSDQTASLYVFTLGNYLPTLGQLFLWQNYSASIYLIHFKFGRVKDIFMVNVSIALYFLLFAILAGKWRHRLKVKFQNIYC